MSALDAIWRGLCDGSTNPPDDPHLRKMVLVQARNRSMHPDETERLDALKVLRRVGGSEAMTCANAFARDVSLTVRRRLLQIGLEAGEDGWIVLRKVAADDAALDWIELSFKDQQLTRGDIWHFRRLLIDRAGDVPLSADRRSRRLVNPGTRQRGRAARCRH